MDEKVTQFMVVTSTSESTAQCFLNMANGSVEQAVQLFFENPDLHSSVAAAESASMLPADPAGTSSRTAIPIESDDDENFLTDEMDTAGDVNEADLEAIRRAQEEDDARLAQQMQGDMYQDTSVRSPIAPTTGTLVDPDFGNYGGSRFDDQDYEDNEASRAQYREEQRRRRLIEQQRHRQAAFQSPFRQSAFEEAGTPAAGNANGSSSSRVNRLAELFRPPFDLMVHLPWEDARGEGKDTMKWLLVNLQDMSIFQCQALNRDIWKDKKIVEVIRESFIFLQYTTTERDAEQFKTFYFHGQSWKNPENFPHVCIVDPRTGEQVKVWTGSPFPTAKQFHADLVEFLENYSLDPKRKNPVSKLKQPARPRNLDAMTEEEMMQMAIEESKASAALDSDSHESAGSEAGVEPENEASDLEEPAQPSGPSASKSTEVSLFDQITNDHPHNEPAAQAPNVTRIQFKHSNGRVIRRFALDDPVRRIYEWLKSDPLEGRQGTEFELRTSPGNQNLIEVLDQTIKAAGLNQGTVMVEYID